jgi:hypothetical protein
LQGDRPSLPTTACAQGFYASLELLPMWGGVDSDVELYASGRCLEDEGEWAGGQDLTGKQEQGARLPGCCAR